MSQLSFGEVEVTRSTVPQVTLSRTSKRGKVTTTVAGQVLQVITTARYATPAGIYLTLAVSKKSITQALKQLRQANLVTRTGIGCYMIR